jgi:K+/H+ antiporter YhaU regulatory subunit KhtT
VELADLREVLPQAEEVGAIAVADDVADRSAPFVVPGDSLDLVMHLFGRTHRDELPVCQSSEGRVIAGVVTKRAVIDAYNRRIFQADLTGGFGSLLDAVREGRTMEVLGGVHMGEMDVPPLWVGKTLAECAPRKRHGVEVVLVHRTSEEGKGIEGRPGVFPAPDLVLEAGDRVLVMGTPEAIRELGR